MVRCEPLGEPRTTRSVSLRVLRGSGVALAPQDEDDASGTSRLPPPGHSRESGNLCLWLARCPRETEIPAFAGMTPWVGLSTDHTRASSWWGASVASLEPRSVYRRGSFEARLRLAPQDQEIAGGPTVSPTAASFRRTPESSAQAIAQAQASPVHRWVHEGCDSGAPGALDSGVRRNDAGGEVRGSATADTLVVRCEPKARLEPPRCLARSLETAWLPIVSRDP